MRSAVRGCVRRTDGSGIRPAGKRILSQSSPVRPLQLAERGGESIRVAGQCCCTQVSIELAGPRKRHLQKSANRRRSHENDHGEPRDLLAAAADETADIEDQG